MYTWRVSGIIGANIPQRPYMYYIDIFRALNKEKVRYLVVGALAMNLHGVPRMTSDLDIMIDLTPANIARFIKSINSLGLTPRVPVNLKSLADRDYMEMLHKEKNMLVLNLYNPVSPYQQLDVFIKNPVEFAPAYKNSVVYNAGGVKVPTLCVADLITMKEMAGRKQDRSDISILNRLKDTEDQ